MKRLALALMLITTPALAREPRPQTDYWSTCHSFCGSFGTEFGPVCFKVMPSCDPNNLVRARRVYVPVPTPSAPPRVIIEHEPTHCHSWCDGIGISRMCYQECN
jgi:hypothetical protein